MGRKIAAGFIIFGLLFAAFNFVDAQLGLTGGDMPLSLVLNVPTMMLNGKISQLLNNIQDQRVSMLKERFNVTDVDLRLSREALERMAPEEKGKLLAKMELYRSQAFGDPVIGQYGLMSRLCNVLDYGFPITSAVAWGCIGLIGYLILWCYRRVPW